jgi:hypothetical protein
MEGVKENNFTNYSLKTYTIKKIKEAVESKLKEDRLETSVVVPLYKGASPPAAPLGSRLGLQWLSPWIRGLRPLRLPWGAD